MTALLGALPAKDNFSIFIDRSHRSPVKIFVPHGGCIEPCTEPIAMAIAKDRFDLFAFSGVRTKDCFKTLHVTSTHYDEPECLSMAREATLAIAIHGCEGEREAIMIGGGNEPLVQNLLAHLKGLGYPAVKPEGGLSGSDENNFVNFAKHRGIQLELSAGFRRQLFPSFPRSGHRDPAAFPKFVDVMRDWIGTINLPAA
jgi:phage replication-related protein YjqB (UPF0714/DUF867 family)